VIVQDRPETTQVNDPGDELAVYSVMVLPPLSAGADQVSVACAADVLTDGAPGAPGTDSGVTANVAVLEFAEAPAELVVLTVNV
jgi:hypothetical protein